MAKKRRAQQAGLRSPLLKGKRPRGPSGRFISRDDAQWVKVETGQRKLDKPYTPAKSKSLAPKYKANTWAYLASKSRPKTKPLQESHRSNAKNQKAYAVKALHKARKVEKRPKSRAKTTPGKPGLVKVSKADGFRITRSVWNFGFPHGLDLARALTHAYQGKPDVRMTVSVGGKGQDGPNWVGSATDTPSMVRFWLDNIERLPSYQQMLDDVDEDSIRVEVEVLQLKRG